MDYQKKLSDFIAQYGEEAVIKALDAFAADRERVNCHPAKAKKMRSASKKFVKKAKPNPEGKAKLAELGIVL